MAEQIRVLVVDDCADALELIAGELGHPDLDLCRASNGEEAWLAFQAHRPDIVVTDVRMPKADGFDLLHRVRPLSDVPIVLLTAYAEVPAAVAAMRSGADDYLRYPDDLDRLEARVRQLVRRRGLAPRDAAERRLCGSSEVVRQLRQQLRILAPLRAPVLLMGEEGSGRTRCAEVLHELSETPLPLRMVTAEAPEEVEEPAVVVLREPERFDDALQRFWAGEIHRVRGKSSPIERVLVVSRGAAPGAAPPFHPHLWREVSKLQVEVPALRDRGPDLPPLARELAREAARRLGREPLQLADEVCEVLARASWVGNVAELERIIEKAVARAAGAFLGGAALEEAIRLDIEQRRDGLARQRVARRGAEREQLISLLDECGGNVAEISRRLGLTRGAVTYRLKKHGLAV